MKETNKAKDIKIKRYSKYLTILVLVLLCGIIFVGCNRNKTIQLEVNEIMFLSENNVYHYESRVSWNSDHTPFGYLLMVGEYVIETGISNGYDLMTLDYLEDETYDVKVKALGGIYEGYKYLESEWSETITYCRVKQIPTPINLRWESREITAPEKNYEDAYRQGYPSGLSLNFDYDEFYMEVWSNWWDSFTYKITNSNGIFFESNYDISNNQLFPNGEIVQVQVKINAKTFDSDDDMELGNRVWCASEYSEPIDITINQLDTLQILNVNDEYTNSLVEWIPVNNAIVYYVHISGIGFNANSNCYGTAQFSIDLQAIQDSEGIFYRDGYYNFEPLEYIEPYVGRYEIYIIAVTGLVEDNIFYLHSTSEILSVLISRY